MARKSSSRRQRAKPCRLNVASRGKTLRERARDFIARHAQHHVKDLGMRPKAALAAAYDEARRKGLPVPEKRRNPKGVVVGDSALELRYQGGEGKRSGKMRGPWKHPFDSADVQILGNRDGSLSLRSKSGERLWDYFEV